MEKRQDTQNFTLMPRYLTTQAIVINHRDFQESDQFVSLLTENEGKIIAIAKGVRSPKSHRRGSLELGNIIKAVFYEKNDRYWLAETTVINHTLSASKSLTQLNLIFYFLEIINHFIAENQQLDGVFDTVSGLMQSVGKNDFGSLVSHEITLLETLGFGVPDEIKKSYTNHDLPECQKNIKIFLESIIERPLKSSRLFK